MTIVERIARMHPELTGWRRDIHAHPELGFEETRTSDLVAAKLAAFGCEVHRGLGKTGVVGTLRAGIEQVNTAITQMDEVTQQNAALVEQAAAAAESMEEQAGNLATAVGIFKMTQQAGRTAQAKLAAPARLASVSAQRKPVTVVQHGAHKGNGQHPPARAKAGKGAGDEEWAEF